MSTQQIALLLLLLLFFLISQKKPIELEEFNGEPLARSSRDSGVLLDLRAGALGGN